MTSEVWVTVSMHVKAWKSNTWYPRLNYHGLAKSTATSNYGTTNSSCGNELPYSKPCNFVLWHVSHYCIDFSILFFKDWGYKWKGIVLYQLLISIWERIEWYQSMKGSSKVTGIIMYQGSQWYLT